jgi:Uma2 family endonuclease
MSTTATRLTVEQFLELPEQEGVKRELVAGELLEMSTGGPMHEMVKARFCRKLGFYFESNDLPGNAFSETMYRLSKYDAPIPDVSIVLSGRLDPGRTGKTTIAPDIAIEVVSSEPAATLQKKIKLYLDGGVRAVWAVYPELAFIDVYTIDGVRRVSAGEQLEDAVLLPGFSVPVATFFEGL